MRLPGSGSEPNTIGITLTGPKLIKGEIPRTVRQVQDASASIMLCKKTPSLKTIAQKTPQQEYENAAKAEVEDIDSDNEYAPSDDSLNFLGNAPGCRSLNDGWLEEL